MISSIQCLSCLFIVSAHQVKDRMAVETTDFERRCVSPPGLQEAIDSLVTSTPKGRSFVR